MLLPLILRDLEESTSVTPLHVVLLLILNDAQLLLICREPISHLLHKLRITQLIQTQGASE